MTDTTGKRRKLKRQEGERLRERFVAHSKPEDLENQANVAILQVPTRVDLPLGELFNPEMSELLKAWVLVGCTFLPGKITSQHQFCAQGLEGMVSIEPVPLHMALWAMNKTGIYRIAIFVPHGWTCNLIQDTASLQEDGGCEQDRTASEVDE